MNRAMEKIVVAKTSELEPTLRNFVFEANERQFGSVPIVREHKWSPPDWTIVVLVGEKPASFVNIVERVGRVDGRTVKIAGGNNLMTLPEYRDKGHALKLAQKFETLIFNNLKVDMGLLLCATALIPFYEKSGWKRVSCPVIFDQPDRGKVTWGAETMVLKPDHSALAAQGIDLCGLPW